MQAYRVAILHSQDKRVQMLTCAWKQVLGTYHPLRKRSEVIDQRVLQRCLRFLIKWLFGGFLVQLFHGASDNFREALDDIRLPHVFDAQCCDVLLKQGLG